MKLRKYKIVLLLNVVAIKQSTSIEAVEWEKKDTDDIRMRMLRTEKGRHFYSLFIRRLHHQRGTLFFSLL